MDCKSTDSLVIEERQSNIVNLTYNTFKLRLLVLVFSLLLTSVNAGVDWSQHVNPFIGTVRGSGSTYPGAQCPFGMLSFSPHTEKQNHGSGYDYTSDKIRGFGLVHISGVGCDAVCELPFMPVVGKLTKSPATDKNAYSSKFRHEMEEAAPGYYSVTLDNYDIDVELAATVRCGIANISYPQTSQGHMIFAPTASANGMRDGEIKIDFEDNSISGWVHGGGFCHVKTSDYVIYYYAKFDSPFTDSCFWKGEDKVEGQDSIAGGDVSACVSFDCDGSNSVKMKVGISYVSVDNAKDNLATELSGWDFDAVKESAREQWNESLDKVQVKGGDKDDLTMFYTALYHSILLPSIFDDCNGQYVGMDDKIYTVESGHHVYATFSGWDTYRTQAQLWGMLYPEAASDFCQTLIETSKQTELNGGGGLPLWSMFNDETKIMAGYPAVPFAANAYAFGARDFDVQELTNIMINAGKKKAFWGRNNHVTWTNLDMYMKYGYYAYDSGTYCPVSQNVEYAIADFSIAQMAMAIGDMVNYQYFRDRSQSVFNLLHPTKKYLWGRLKDGSWKDDFDPKSNDGCQEGTSTHYTWGIAHNLNRLIMEIGGQKEAESRLDWLMQEIAYGYEYGNPHYLAGNEPCFGIVPVYNWTGSPWKAQKNMRKVMTASFSNTPKGIPGDDDSGAMSAWYVFAALGLYPEVPGVGGFSVTGPLFPEVSLELGSGKQVTIVAENAGLNRPYVKALKLNGSDCPQTWLSLEELTESNKNILHFEMDEEPAKEWASEYRPPSFNRKIETAKNNN